MSPTNWMIYGANGYTGALLADEAVRRGHRPILAGRSIEKIRPIAERLGLEARAAVLDDAAQLRAACDGVDLVLNAAGPFVSTSKAVLEACLDARASYLDVSGELAVLEHTLSLDARARERGVALVSGVGFDVVPTDCLAREVAASVPDATHLEIAIDLGASPSPGTAKATVASIAAGTFVREDGVLLHPRAKPSRREVRFSHGRRRVLPVSWGDLATAYRTTGIANIVTYMAAPKGVGWLADCAVSALARMLASEERQRWAERWIERNVHGPDAQRRRAGRSYVWARASRGEEAAVEAWLEAGDGYQFTVDAALLAVERLRACPVVGAMTPALAFGADFALSVPGTRRVEPVARRGGSPTER